VVLDDADTNIEVVTRGEDLRSSTDIHCLLQKLLGLPSPIYFHHPVILGEDGKKLSKRHKSPSFHNLQDTHLTLKNILRKELVINF
jgi:glutamyl-Q tRNA(Asp) synthetase